MFLRAAVIVLYCFSVDGQGRFGNKTTRTYGAGESLSIKDSSNVTQSRGLIKFENQFDSDYVPFDDQNLKLPGGEPFKFQTDQEPNNPSINFNDVSGPTRVKFDNFGQDVAENGLKNPTGNELQSGNVKRKRRRRKPKQQFPGKSGFWNFGYPKPNGPGLAPGQHFGPESGSGHSFGPVPEPGQSFGPAAGIHNFRPNRFHPEFNGQWYKPPRRPQPSLASDALEAVTGALTSIAHNDDHQCVPRLLCEAAAGGALGSSSILESVSGLQPLLTLLSAYNGISSNPLFVFGRAAFLGMSSKANPGSCRYAYSLCPTDPELLVHYLNNHNGGFFRFFNAPQHGEQNLEQFYNQLSQNYGLYQPNQGNNQEFYGLLNPGMYQNQVGQPNLYPHGYGYQQNYGVAYPYNKNYNNGNGNLQNNNRFNIDSKVRVDFDEDKIEKRIQNKPATFLNDNSVVGNSKWLFPGEDDDIGDENEVGVQYINSDDFGFTDYRKAKTTLKFPDTVSTYNNENIPEFNRKPIDFYTTKTIRTPKGILFPDSQKNIIDYNMEHYHSPLYSNGFSNIFNNVDKRMNDAFKGDGFNDNYKSNQDEPGVTTVYVIRGNGDPSKPEIVKLRPGETLQ